jgi:hypothetical protein
MSDARAAAGTRTCKEACRAPWQAATSLYSVRGSTMLNGHLLTSNVKAMSYIQYSVPHDTSFDSDSNLLAMTRRS